MILRFRAPFAAFRPFQAGAYRSSLPVMPPSTAYGLVLNLASIDARDPSSLGPTRYRHDAPTLRVAVGVRSVGGVATLYQQLHVYPVGESGAELKDRTHGAKYFITPGRRELLVDYDGVVAFESDEGEVEARVAAALDGRPLGPRYGLPFAGDNNFLFDAIELAAEASASWYARFTGGRDAPVRGSVRLPIRIDRDDQSKTEVALFAPAPASALPPPEAWVHVGP